MAKKEENGREIMWECDTCRHVHVDPYIVMPCSNRGCGATATHRVFWPGAKPVLFCDKHHDNAHRVAYDLGLEWHTERYTPPSEDDNDHD